MKQEIFMQWLHDVGGSYTPLVDRQLPNPKRAHYEPKHKLILRPLDPKKYRVDGNGSVRKLSDKALEIAEKLGI
jgi:hypothetical protein